MLLNRNKFVKNHLEDIILVVAVILISLLSFALGYIFATYHQKKPLEFEYYKESMISSGKQANFWGIYE